MTVKLVDFDFSADHYKQAVDKLDHILSADGWGRYGLLYDQDETILLTRLLHLGGIAVYEHTFPYKRDYTQEVRQRADLLGSLMRKRGVSEALLEMAELFPQEHDVKETYNKAVYFPELRAYVRCSGLSPEYLLELFERDGCDKVIVFPGWWLSDDESEYYVFELVMPRETFLTVFEAMRNKRFERLSEAIRNLPDSVIPSPPPDWDKE